MKTIFVSAYRVPCHAVSKLRNCGCRHENNNNVTAFFELWMFLMFHQKFTKMWLTSTNRMSVHSSQSRDCLVSVRCVVADHYQAEPVAGLDPLVSDFTGYNIRKVPIIRWVMSLCPLEHISYHSLIGCDEIIFLSPVSGCSAAPWLASAPVSTCTESSPTSTCRCRATWRAGTRAGGSLSLSYCHVS